MATISGTAASDSLKGGEGADSLSGFAGNDTLAAGLGDDTLIGGAGNDVLYGEGGVNTFVFSGKFADYIIEFDLLAFTITDKVSGRDGVDTAYTVSWLQFSDRKVFWTDYEGPNITGTSANDTLPGTSLPEIIVGLDGNDSISGLGGSDNISGQAGADTLDGGPGNDELDGGNGNDLLIGGTGNDQVLGGLGQDTLIGGDGNDVLYPQTGNDSIDGGAGVDILAYGLDPGTTGVAASLKTGVATGSGWIQTFANIENLSGGNFDDQLTGDDGRNLIDGHSGNDTLTGGKGDDSLYGGKGNDTAVFAGRRSDYTITFDSAAQGFLVVDSVANRDGRDVLKDIESFSFSGEPLNTITGTVRDDSLLGTSAMDLLEGLGGNDTLEGGAADDQLFGGDGIDTASFAISGGSVIVSLQSGTATGGAGSDTLSGIENVIGSPFADFISGDSGFNRLNGAGGDDLLFAGDGGDVLDGGDGVDTAVYDFSSAVSVDLAGGFDEQIGRADVRTLLNIENVRAGSGGDTLTGNAHSNQLEGGLGNDVLAGGAGSDMLNGGPGIDTALYSSARANYVWIAAAGGYTLVDLRGSDGTDILQDIERLSFSDGKVALDIAGNAGTVARILGAVFGAAAVENQRYAGIGLSLLDGGMTEQSLMAVALDAALGAGATNSAVVELLYTNLVGMLPTAEIRDAFVGLIEQGVHTQVSLALFAAQLDLNASNIQLTGLAATGLAYI
jgi:Ca2+-binding RTX toxin-like protein